jgi:hypothetical protein
MIDHFGDEPHPDAEPDQRDIQKKEIAIPLVIWRELRARAGCHVPPPEKPRGTQSGSREKQKGGDDPPCAEIQKFR